MKKEEDTKGEKMQYLISQNPKYNDRNRSIRKYFVSDSNGKPVGPRKIYGISALKPEKVILDTNSFHDKLSLEKLIAFLERRRIPFQNK